MRAVTRFVATIWVLFIAGIVWGGFVRMFLGPPRPQESGPIGHSLCLERVEETSSMGERWTTTACADPTATMMEHLDCELRVLDGAAPPDLDAQG